MRRGAGNQVSPAFRENRYAIQLVDIPSRLPEPIRLDELADYFRDLARRGK